MHTLVIFKDSSQPERMLGFTLLVDIWNLSDGEEILVQFNNWGQRINKEACVLANFLGTVASNLKLTPLHILDRRKYLRTEKEKLTALIKMKTIFFQNK